MSQTTLAIVSLLAVVLAWKVVKGVFKMLSMAAVILMAAFIYYRGLA